jgi:hypothetical protein
MATDDSDVWAREKRSLWPSEIARETASKAKSGYDAELEASAARDQTPAKKSDPLPQPGDPYRAHARFLNRLAADTLMIFFVLKDFSYEGFRYSDLRRLRWLPTSKPGQGPSLLLRFCEAEITDVQIEGMHLLDIQHWIGQGVMPWVWEKPPGFNVQESNAAVITRIAINEAKGRMSGED